MAAQSTIFMWWNIVLEQSVVFGLISPLRSMRRLWAREVSWFPSQVKWNWTEHPLWHKFSVVSGWQSGLRRCVQVAVSSGAVGSNPLEEWVRISILTGLLRIANQSKITIIMTFPLQWSGKWGSTDQARCSARGDLTKDDQCFSRCSQLCPALAGNRTRASRMAGEISTTDPQMLALRSTLSHKISLTQIYTCRTQSPCSRQEMLERHSS